ncbi:MAG TPA: hypothetical protein PKC30_08575 [Saprospiraceae bacterium]|nr:hypothetical protein [Saprospiraceae bacterium]
MKPLKKLPWQVTGFHTGMKQLNPGYARELRDEGSYGNSGRWITFHVLNN